MRLEITPSLAVKLGSIVVHADETTGPYGHTFDVIALRGLCDDDEVRAWLADFAPGLLPVKRNAGDAEEQAERIARYSRTGDGQ